MKQQSQHPFLTTGETRILAHRGASHVIPPGNSMAAFRRSLLEGVDHLETDVQLSSDGEIVVFHDRRLDDITTGTGTIADHSWPELEALFYCNNDGETTEHGLVRLEDALTAFPDAFWNIDVKKDAAVAPVSNLLRRLDLAERVCVAAFEWRRQRRLRRVLPGFCSAHARPEIVVLRVASWLRLPLPRMGDVVQVPTSQRGVTIVDERFVSHCHRLGIAVHVWTVNDPSEMRRLRNLGVDALITDDPATARRMVTR